MVGHDQTTSVVQDRTLRVGRHVAHEIRGARTVDVHQNDTQTVHGDRALTVKGHNGITIHGSHSLTVGDKDKPSQLDLFAWGDASFGSHGTIAILAEKGVTLLCGKSSIRITDQEIAICSPKALSGDEVHARGKGPSLTLGDGAEILAKTVSIFSKSGSLELDDDARLDGDKVKLHCRDNPPASAEDPTACSCRSRSSSPTRASRHYAGKPYTLVAAGRKYEGTTGGDGMMTEQIPVAAKTARLILWLGDKPEGGLEHLPHHRRRRARRIDLQGAWMRLQNLGYHATGQPEGSTTPCARR